VEDLEARKAEENRKMQADLDKYVAEQKARLQANLDEVAKQKESFGSWRKQKQVEEQRIADCVFYFVTDNPISTATNPHPAVKPGS
jgi:dimeric dUTPase (all-alpha-NTP-PPase superfamily)